MNVDRLGLVRVKLELLRQVIHPVERAPTKEAALEALRRLLVALEAEYEAMLLDDPLLRWALGSSSNRSNGLAGR